MNQTFNPELPVNGYSAIYLQTGAVRNQGLELSLGYKKHLEQLHMGNRSHLLYE